MNTKTAFDKKNIKRPGILYFGSLITFLLLQTAWVQKPPRKISASYTQINSASNELSKPNIIWITTEGLPLKVLSCYGGTLIQTPNIDRIAKEGMLFRNSFCTNALCAPSRATLLTGKYSHINGMISNPGSTTNGATRSSFDATQETFAKLLQQNGYKTGIVGKWHLENPDGSPSNPATAGFDYFVFKNGAGGPYYDSTGYFQNPSLGSKEIVEKKYPGYITDNMTDLAIKGIEEMKGGPFLMAIQFFNAHRPFDPPHKYEHIYDSVQFPEPATFWDDYDTRSAAAREAHQRIEDMMDFNPPKDLTPRQRREWSYQQLMRHFLGTLKAQDDNIGRLLDYLDKSGLSKNTIVVFTGDHGFFLGEHGWFDKRFMYEEALRVPWMIRYPGVIKPGSVSNAWVVNIDNAPTILDMAHIKIPDDMQGKSLVPLFNGSIPADWRHSMYYHYYEFAGPHWVMPNYGIRTERYKLIYYYTINEWELFDLQKDPNEMDNLFLEEGMEVKPGYEKVLQDLLTQLEALRKRYKDDTGAPVKFWPRNTYN
ncbi:MAG TPA: sulfatase [Chitinophagaceae bacterium]|nr:sulfatase [Chitinophagaceae bacterium]